MFQGKRFLSHEYLKAYRFCFVYYFIYFSIKSVQYFLIQIALLCVLIGAS